MFKNLLHWLALQKSPNESILDLLSERLHYGAIEHGEEVPLDGTRDHLQDAIEEALDMIVYLAAMLIELQNKTKRRK